VSLLAAIFAFFPVSSLAQGTAPAQPAPQARPQTSETQDQAAVGGGNGPGVEILSDTLGVDFQPYLRAAMQQVYDKWLRLLPPRVHPPERAGGVTVIRFTLAPDGKIAAMHLDRSTHDDELNRAAWSAITSVGTFPSLPSEFHGPNLELRVNFLVNQGP
jgi:TonB family protein